MKDNIKNIIKTLKEKESELAKDGWVKSDMGAYASSKVEAGYNNRFDLYIRRRNLAGLMAEKNGDYLEKSPKLTDSAATEKLDKIKEKQHFDTVVSKDSMGTPKTNLTPAEPTTEVAMVDNSSLPLPVLSDFASYPSLAAARTGRPAQVIAFDSEWYYEDDSEISPRQLLTWQFATIHNEELVEYVFVRKNPHYNLDLELALGRILDSLEFPDTDLRKVRKWTSLGEIDPATGNRVENVYNSIEDAVSNSKCDYPDKKKYHTTNDWSNINHISVVLLCHAGKVDISALNQQGVSHKDILRYCSEVQGGLISLQPTKIYPMSVNPIYAKQKHIHKYAVSLSVADTMCHAPAGMKSLKALGNAVGWNKVQLEEGMISEMNKLLQEDPRKYFEYASNDSVVTLLYGSALYGYNEKFPVTVTSATAKVMKETMMEYLGCSNTKEFDRVYRGLETVGHGLTPRNDRPGYIESQSKEPISDKANTIQYYSSQAFHGGYNNSSEIGWYPVETFDYDMQNAYPTAMTLVCDVDWENPIRTEIINRELTLQDFTIPVIGGYAPMSMMVAYVRFEFPENVKYCCIPVNVDGIPMYPRTSRGLDGVYACGPELYLALRLGAHVFVERGFFLNTRIDAETGQMSRSLQVAVKQLVTDRNRAKSEHGEKSLEELILKTMVNSGYGKNAQNVVQKDTWTAFNDEMEDLGCSAITNPASAMMITSIVRAVLLAAQNQCHENGYKTHSVTTDGFISDMPEELLKSLDLYGFRIYLEQARLFLTDGQSAEIWETKHCQNDLLNFTTRGNVSLHSKTNPMIYKGKEYQGVCAHNSSKSGFEPDSYKDRLWLMKSVLSRTGTVDYTDKEWTGFKELVEGKEFSVKEVTRHIRMDFDMKRKPDRASFLKEEVSLNGEVYEIANFSTVPFESVAEFKEFRNRKNNVSCLRTMQDWEMFWFKTDAKSSAAKVRDIEWSILNSCIMGHRAGFWKIPKLDEFEGQERCDWINSHNTSNKVFKLNDWKNAGRNARQASMLPREVLKDKLDELIHDYKG